MTVFLSIIILFVAICLAIFIIAICSLRSANDFNDIDNNIYNSDLAQCSESEKSKIFENNINAVEYIRNVSHSYLKSISESNRSFIFLIISTIFGSILYYYSTEFELTYLLWFSFFSIYSYLIVSYVLTKMLTKQYKITIGICEKYLRSMRYFEAIKEYEKGIMYYFYFYTDINNIKSKNILIM